MKSSDESIFVEAGEKIEIFSRRFSSVPLLYQFTAKSTDSSKLSGLVEVHCKQSVFSVPVRFLQLSDFNSVQISMWDTFMTIYVVAESDMLITVPAGLIKPQRSTLLLTALLVSAAVLIFFSLRQ